MRIIFEDVAKSYGLVDALKDVDFRIKSGQFVFLYGPSGSGKSTIIKLILGQIRPTAGRITVG